MMTQITPILLLVTAVVLHVCSGQYLVYCPCMGRFGNQADQFLGSLAFSKSLNRSLVLPPFISYSSSTSKVKLIPWDAVFDLARVSQYHEVVTMEQFMSELAPSVWPAHTRTSWCYTPRPGDSKESCNAKQGNPFRPFWDSFNVDFVRSEMYAPLNFATSAANIGQWSERYPMSSYPVLAMTGAPASFPLAQQHVSLQLHVQWSRDLLTRADDWMTSVLGATDVPYIGIHLRNGGDWLRACQHVDSAGVTNLFSSPQCLGYHGELGKLTPDLCAPGHHIVIQQLTDTLRQYPEVRHVFIASDHDHMMGKLSTIFSQDGVTFHRLEEADIKDDIPDYLLDLVILTKSKHFIGNCVSSFTALVKRIRDVHRLSSTFWAFNQFSHKTEL